MIKIGGTVKRFKRIYIYAALLGPLAAAASGQEWYAGAIGGFGYAPSLTVTSPSGSANTGLSNSYALGAYLGEEMYNRWGGEVRYLYRQSDLKLESGGTSVHFAGHNNLINGDFLYHFRPRESTVRPFIAFGAGMEFLTGTGAESASQPLGKFAALTNTRETLPAGDVGAGVKANFRKSWQFRAEVRDYISPAPHKVIAAAPGTSLTGWLNDIIVTGSIGYRW
ncbi:MAG TPA: outer membrane beta-barrel protein [Bryobacteraceae bacterium]|nr:outer membrane beta-barrel protein [Bryobacteraceae bacterium]